ncbi:MAG: polysaccharide pyruvyl transferase family protein [Phycisphaerales bacterium JB043]
MADASRATRIGLVGAAPSTGNLGVTALCYSVLDALFERMPDLDVTVFDYGRGPGRSHQFDSHTVSLEGATLSKRFYASECLWNMWVASKVGGAWNNSVRAMRDSDAIIDMSGGDSFTDLYGPRIFRAMTMRKRIAIESGTPLILGPQTYGPFGTPRAQSIASGIVRDARMCWARDARSYELLKDLLGDAFDAARHKLGVDCAFLLPVRDVDDSMQGLWREWLAVTPQERQAPVIGLNVSGLLANDPDAAHAQYGFRARYVDVILGLIERVLDHSDARLLLIPHVDPTGRDPESDVDACESVFRHIDSTHSDRVAMVPAMRDPRQIKWAISRCDWFCGTRMHSTIAGLSTRVATTAIAYSPKTRGVFETCGVADAVIDPRELDTQDVIDGLWSWWERRDELRRALEKGLSDVKNRARTQMDDIASLCADRLKEAA